jgi:hypothetical protein
MSAKAKKVVTTGPVVIAFENRYRGEVTEYGTDDVRVIYDSQGNITRIESKKPKTIRIVEMTK